MNRIGKRYFPRMFPRHSATLLTLLIAPALALGQIPTRANGIDYGPLQSSTILTYTYADPRVLFSQSMGATQVVSNHAHAAALINPALLGESKPRWASGQASLRYASLLPELNVPDLWNIHQQAIYQNSGIGMSLSWTHHHFGAMLVDTTPTLENNGYSGNIFAFSAGKSLGETQGVVHFLGGTASWIFGPTILSEMGYRNQGFLLDFGYLGVFAKMFRLGLSAQNLGMPVKGLKPMFVYEQYQVARAAYKRVAEDEDFLLTPPRIHGGIGLQHQLQSDNLHILETGVSMAYTLEFQRDGFKDARGFSCYELNWLLLHTLHTEYGVLMQSELPIYKWGFGIDLFNHLHLHFTSLHSSGFGWNNQRSFALSLHHLLSWKKSDWTWWRR
jgi:hypothetical protein